MQREPAGRDRMNYVKTLGAVAATGAISVLLFKVLVAAASPILGMLFGFLMSALKIGLVVALGAFLYRMFRRRRRDETVA